MTVIDLGRVGHEGDDPPAASRPRPRHRWRRLLVTVVAVCCTLTVTGSARPDPRGLVQLWDTALPLDTGAYQVSRDDVFVLDPAGGRRLTAHDARTGTVRWSTDAGDSSGLAGVAAGTLLTRAGGTVVDQVQPDGSVSSRELDVDTVAVDTVTGRLRWRQRGEVITTLDDHALLLEWDRTGEWARRLRMVRLRDGGTVWSRDHTDAVSWTIDMTSGVRADRLVTVTARGRAEVIALADGAVVTAGTLARPGGTGNDDYSALSMQGRLLVQDRTVQGRSTVTAYDIDTLRPLWSVEQSSAGSYDCGPVVCISDGESIFGHDPATGARLWRLSETSVVYRLTGDRLLAAERDGARHTVLEGTTVRGLAELGRGMPVFDSRGRLAYLIAGTLQPPGRTSVSSFDPASAEVVLRGTVAPVQTCRNEGDLLTCVTEGNRLTVTDLG